MDTANTRGILLHTWYALQVRLRRERVAAQLLEDKGYEVFLPWLFLVTTALPSKPGSSRLGSALFPGYFFFRQHEMPAPLIITTPFIIRIVGTGAGTSCTMPVSDLEIQSIRSLLDSHRPITRVDIPCSGDIVRVVGGPLRGLEGVFCQAKGRSRLIITVASVGRGISVEVEQSWIEPVDAGIDHKRIHVAVASK